MLTVYPFLLKFLYIPLKNNYQSKAPLGNIFCLLTDTAAIVTLCTVNHIPRSYVV
jgi:hypothetical protein